MIEKIRRFSLPLQYDEKLISKDKYRIYWNAVLMTPGTYIDALSGEVSIIDREVLRKTALNWSENYLNIDHDVYSVLSRIGYVEPKGWNGESVIGNLKILPVTQRAKDVISLIDAGLITDLSVEMKSVEEWDNRKSGWRILDITYTGAAIVTKGACPHAKIK